MDDYKHMAPPAVNRKKSSPIVILLLLAVIPAATAALVWLVYQSQQPAMPLETAAEIQPQKNSPAAAEQPSQQQPKTVTSPPEQPLDFYTVLPYMEVPIITTSTEEELTQSEIAAKKPANQSNNSNAIGEKQLAGDAGQYYLQIGSFQNMQAATTLQLEAKKLNLNASIHRVTLINDNVWYRVYLGPFATINSSDATRQVLTSNGIKHTLMKRVSKHKG